MRKRKWLLSLMVTWFGFALSAQATTYRLQRVTSVEAGQKYVFEQGGYVMNGEFSSDALQTTNEFSTYGLKGTETYVWEITTAKGGVRMKKNSQSKFLKSDDSSLSFDSESKGTIWSFTLQRDGMFMVKNVSNNYFLGYGGINNHNYKAYDSRYITMDPHSIVIYKLVSETEGKRSAALRFDNIYQSIVKGAAFTAPTLTYADGLDGAITYTSNNTDVATVEATTGALTITGTGFVTITATSAETGTYDAGEATYTILVMGGNGSSLTPYTVSDLLSGYMAVANDKYICGYIAGWYDGSGALFSSAADNTHIVLTDAKNETEPGFMIKLPLEAAIQSTQGLFSYPNKLKSKVTAKYSLYSSGFISTTAVEALSYSATLTAAQYATFSAADAVDFTGLEVYPYTAKVEDGHIRLDRLQDGLVAANTPVVLFGETAGAYDVPVTTREVSTPEGSLLEISDGSTATGSNIYVLANVEGNVGFRRWKSATSLTKGRVFLRYTGSGAPDFLGIDRSETAGVEALTPAQNERAGKAVYTLAGQRVSSPTTGGLYIMNGKKYLVR